MTRPLIQIGDVVREMNETEFAQYEKDLAEHAANAEAVLDAINARENALAKLEALGLTPAEVAALVGA